ncbi:MAG: DUF4365 domain-containing protein [Leadbetterella sp.]|nr:DUF4365 domain-containing protein [Leadbetterella sp.]
MPLTLNNIEAELSYAYLHAIASKSGLSCTIANRSDDNYGIDAHVSYFDKIPGTYITDVELRVQLKATKNKGAETPTHISYPFSGIQGYDKLRENKGGAPRILIVLFLSEIEANWLTISEEELIMKHAAYWVCLYDAPPSTNKSSETIYLPKANLLTPDALKALCQEIGIGNIPTYIKP